MKTIELEKNDMDLIAIAILGEMNKLTKESLKALKEGNDEKYNELTKKCAEYSALYFDEFSMEKCN